MPIRITLCFIQTFLLNFPMPSSTSLWGYRVLTLYFILHHHYNLSKSFPSINKSFYQRFVNSCSLLNHCLSTPNFFLQPLNLFVFLPPQGGRTLVTEYQQTSMCPMLIYMLIFFISKIYVSVVLLKDKDDLHHDHQYRHRELTTLDHTLLDGDMFLQVSFDLTLMFLGAKMRKKN